MNININCPDEIHDIHVRNLLRIAELFNYETINNYLITNSDNIKDEYNVVTLAIYYAVKFDSSISCIRTLLRSFWGDLAICVNGYTLLQTMVLCDKPKEFIKAAVEAGICTFGYSTLTDNQVLAIACAQLWKVKNNCRNKRDNCLDIIEYLLSIKIEPSIRDMTYLAFTFFGNEEFLFGHDLQKELEILKEKSIVFKKLTLKMETEANGILSDDSEHTICSLLKLNTRKVAIILQNKKFKDPLKSKLSNLEIFGCLFASHFGKAQRLSMKIETAVKHLKKTVLNYDCVFCIIDFLTEEDLDNLNKALL